MPDDIVTPMGSNASYLLEMDGRIVHEWRYPAWRAFYAKLLPSGNLAMLAGDNSMRPPEAPEGRVPTWTETVRRIGGIVAIQIAIEVLAPAPACQQRVPIRADRIGNLPGRAHHLGPGDRGRWRPAVAGGVIAFRGRLKA